MFSTTKDLIKHEKRHKDGDNYACQICNNQSKNEKNLNHHLKTKHKDEKLENSTEKKQTILKIQNETTSDTTTQKKKYVRPTNRCHLCTSETLFTLTSLRRHLARYHSTNFKCQKCDKGFQKEDQYKTHMDSHRNKECHLCGEVFKRKQNADIHLIRIHKFNSTQLAKIGRWNPRNQADEIPEYMISKAKM